MQLYSVTVDKGYRVSEMTMWRLLLLGNTSHHTLLVIPDHVAVAEKCSELSKHKCMNLPIHLSEAEEPDSLYVHTFIETDIYMIFSMSV